MIETIDVNQFRARFEQMGRKDQFSYDGLEALYNYLEEYYSNQELDVIALCCDYTENTIEEVRKDYSWPKDKYDDSEVIELLHNNTSVVSETL